MFRTPTHVKTTVGAIGLASLLYDVLPCSMLPCGHGKYRGVRREPSPDDHVGVPCRKVGKQCHHKEVPNTMQPKQSNSMQLGFYRQMFCRLQRQLQVGLEKLRRCSALKQI